MLILSASNLGVSQEDQNSSFTFCGRQFSLFRSHQSKYSAVTTCRKFLEQGSLALMVIHDNEDDNSVWQMVSSDSAQTQSSPQKTMSQVLSRVKSVLETKVF